MIYLIVSDDSLFHRMLSETFLRDQEVWTWAGRRRNGEGWSGPGRPFYGDPAEPDTFTDVAPVRDAVVLVCLKEPVRTVETVEALTKARPDVEIEPPSASAGPRR